MSSKLDGIPNIYYLNLDSELDRRKYMEMQFEKWNINGVRRFSASNYSVEKYDSWKDILHFSEMISGKNHRLAAAITLSTFEMIRYWLETTDEKYLILMEDDYDLIFIEYWHFDWEYLMNSIPYDWDCIQMSFENPSLIPCFLHPILPGHSLGASLINRRYAEKLVSLHYKDGKFDLSQKIGNNYWMNDSNFTGDYFLGHCGKTYCIPLLSVNQRFGSYAENVCRKDERTDLEFSYKAYKKWWTVLRDEYTLEDFFTYGKPNDRIIIPEEFENV